MKRALLSVLISLLLLYIVRELEYQGVRRNESGEFAKLRETFLEPQDYDLIYIGSSRAECSFYPPIIDSMTGLRSYNIGMKGATMPFIRATLEAYLVNSKAPEYVVLNIDIHSFTDSPDTIFDFPRYFPYLSNPALLKGLQENDKRFTAFRWLAPYSMPYFNARYLNNSLRGWTGKPGKYDSLYVRGFAPSLADPSFQTYQPGAPTLHKNPEPFILENLEQIRLVCEKHGSKLVVVVSPLYYEAEKVILNYHQLVSVFRDYTTTKKLPFLDLSAYPRWNDSDVSPPPLPGPVARQEYAYSRTFYSDPFHLNASGAMLFSRNFSFEFLQYIRP